MTDSSHIIDRWNARKLPGGRDGRLRFEACHSGHHPADASKMEFLKRRIHGDAYSAMLPPEPADAAQR